jgi:hypothetical protein
MKPQIEKDNAKIIEALLRATAERFAGLPLEAEPAHFVLEQRRSAP